MTTEKQIFLGEIHEKQAIMVLYPLHIEQNKK